MQVIIPKPESEFIQILGLALEEYQKELNRKGYSRLTQSSYVSAVSRFLDYLSVGEVIPEFDHFRIIKRGH